MVLNFLNIFRSKPAEKALSSATTEILVRARLLQGENLLPQALAAYRLVLEANPAHLDSLAAVAAICMQGGDFEGALRSYSAMISCNGNTAEVYYKRGNVHNMLGRLEAALEDYTSAIALNPKYAYAFCNRGAVLERLGRFEEALSSYDCALGIDSTDHLSHHNRGTVLRTLGRLSEALDSYERALASKEDYAEAHMNRGTILRELRRANEAITSFDRAVELAPGVALSHMAHHGRGLAFADLGQYEDALASYDEAIKLDPAQYFVYSSRGLALRKLDRIDAALASFAHAIALRSDFAEAYFYRGQILQGMQQFDEALASFDKSIELTPDDLLPYLAHSSRGFVLVALQRLDEALTSFDQAIALKSDYVEAFCSRGHVLQELRRHAEAVATYDEAIALAPEGPQAFVAYSSRAFSLKDLKRLEEALESYDRAIELNSDDVETYMNRGGVLQELGRHYAAIESFDQAVELKPDSVDALQGRAFSLLNRGRYEAAIESFDRALALNGKQKYLAGFRRYAQMQVCDWHGFAPYLKQLEEDLRLRKAACAPFQVLALIDSPALHRLAAEVWVAEECPPDDSLGMFPPRLSGDKIRIGYFSSDFRHHPVSLLTAELYELHDRSKFEITGFAFGPSVNDGMRQRLTQAFDRFIDVSDRPDREVAETARRLGIDIAVDLGGFTEFARPKVFALRAAPIQMSYLGYLGTMGASWMDYLLADPTIIPANEQPFFSEKIVYLPSYQVNDSTRQIVDRALTREELGLPAEGFIFSCFNSNYKITPSTFVIWMRILLRVEGSFLFLYAGNHVAERNLRREAESHGIDSRRIVFGKFLAQQDYLARFRTMDLFLDTLPYNAGTTASDALWAGLPVLTCTGLAFAGRVAASLLRAVGLPELITSTPEQYEDTAVHLARNPDLMLNIKRKLTQERLESPLFDTRKFTIHLEAAYTRIYERHRAGLAPENIVVAEASSD